MTEIPLVSIIVPCYNHANYIEQCILSVVNQTYKNIQLIVIDDGSKDNSFEILEKLNIKYDFFLERQPNMGLSKTLNKVITNYVKGKYIAFVASDDYLHPNKIESQVNYYESHPQMGLIFAKAYKVDDEGNNAGPLDYKQPSNCTFDSLLLNCYIPALTVMMKKEVINKVGLFDENIYIEDWDMWLKVADKYPFAFVNEYVAYYRMHGTNVSANHKKMIVAKKEIVAKWQHKTVYKKAYDNVLLEEIALTAIFEKKKAIKLLFREMKLAKYISYYKSIVKLLVKTKL